MGNKSLEISDETIASWALLVRVSQAVLSRVETDLKTADFPPLSWYDALLELQRAKHDGLRPFQLQERMLLAQYNLSRLTDRLTKAGYVVREDCTDDGRGHVLKITREGRALLKRMWPVYKNAIADHYANKLDRGEAAVLQKALGKLE